jgi:branched-chain amino acid transport system substrate-binding protein
MRLQHMTISRRTLLTTAAATALPLARARAQAEPVLKIGCLTDLSGPYKDLAGPGAIAAVHQALEEYGVSAKGMKVEVLSADHQNKPDIGTSIVRQWFDRDGVDLIVEVANSGVALAVAGVAKEKNKVYVNSGAASSDLTGSQCNANTIHWVYDTSPPTMLSAMRCSATPPRSSTMPAARSWAALPTLSPARRIFHRS